MITETQFKEIYARYESSGLTIRSFCMNEGINESKFYYWKKRLQRLLPAGFGFIPLKAERDNPGLAAGHSSVNSVFGSASEDTASNCSFEITYPNGTRLKLWGAFDYESVKSLVLLNR